MIFTIHIRPEAEDDIEDAATWYEKQQENLGQDFLAELSSIFKVLSENPNLYPAIYRDTHRAVIHRFPFNVHYLIEDTSVIVVAVMHGSRHPKRWQSRV